MATGVPAKVVLVEALGAETLIYVKTNEGAQMVARQADRAHVQVGAEVGLQLDISTAHWFDAKGRTVRTPN